MPALKVTVLLEVDGVVPDGYPLVRTLNVDQVQSFNVQRATGGGFVTLPIQLLLTTQALVVSADKATTVRLNGQTDAGIDLAAGGLLLVVGADLDASATTNATLQNASGATAQVQGVAGGNASA